jgi:calcineurin-like phosphoesterase family protein
MSEFITSDTHFGHTNIIKYCNRPFATAEEMDKVLIHNWNDVVTNKDRVWHCGDFCLTNGSRVKYLERVEYLLHELHGHIMLLPGSHDAIFKKLHPSWKYEVVAPVIETELEDRKLVLCHYPMAEWPKSRHGSFHMHGHSHGGRLREIGRSWDCGVDVHDFRPWSEAEVLAKMVEIEREVLPQ